MWVSSEDKTSSCSPCRAQCTESTIQGHRRAPLCRDPVRCRITSARTPLNSSGQAHQKEEEGCSNGSVTIDGRDIRDPHSGAVVGTVELRYSRACQTNWVRMTRLCRNERRLEAYLRDESGNMIAMTRLEVDPPHVYGYGAMWYAPTGEVRVQACGLIDGCDEVCTSLH